MMRLRIISLFIFMALSVVGCFRGPWIVLASSCNFDEIQEAEITVKEAKIEGLEQEQE